MISATDSSTTRRSLVVATVAGATTAILGVVVLVGWYTRTETLIQVLPAFVPMQHNTALSFLLCGIGLVALVNGRTRLALGVGSMAGAVGLLTLIEYLFGVRLGIDELFFEHYITVQTSHPGRMAPNTALCFSLTAAVLIAPALWKKPGQRFWIVGGLGVAVLALSGIAFFGYLTGAQTAYGWGQLTRMAVHTSAGFVALSVGILTFAFRESKVWAATSSAFVSDHPVRERRRIVAASVGIMALVSMGVGLTVIRELYGTGLDAQRDRLAGLVRSRIEMIEAVARFDDRYSRDVPGGSRAATLSQVIDAHERSPGFGRTGEFALARREGDNIVFIAGERHSGPDFVERVGIGSDRAEPMRLALRGESGTIIGTDYRGETVVAAYAPIAMLDLGIVAKMDLAEVRAPFVRSAFLTAAIAILIIVIGAGATMVSIDPLARRVETQARELHSANVELTREAAERQESERATEAIRDRLQLSIDRMPVGYIMWDPDGKVSDWNPAAERIFGFTREEAVGRALLELVVPEELRPVVGDVMEELVSGKEDRYSEPGNNLRKDGSVISCQWFNSPLIGATGEISGVLSMVVDVTERQQAEEQLRRSEVIVASSSDMLALLDEEYTYLAANPAYLEPLGKTVDQLVGKTVADVFGEEFFNRVMRPKADVCLLGERVHFQEWLDFPATGKVYMDVNYYPYFGADHEVRGFVVNTRDITELETARAELHELNVGLERMVEERTEQLVAANREMEAFAYSVSHDLKAPLRAIDGYSAMLEERHEASLPEDAKKLLHVVRTATRQMARLIDDLLGFSRIGRVHMAISDVDMRELAQSVFSDLSKLEDNRSIEFSVGELPTVPADLALIRQVWTNLLQNALKFTGGREVARIEVDCREEPDHWVFRVRDNGAGFDMTYVDKLFRVFQRLHYEEEFPGTGVGLATVDRIVRRHGGEVWAEGEVDAGATIFFRLPRTSTVT